VRGSHPSFLLGASGAGKSLSLKLILGLLRPDAGRILVHGRRVDDMAERDLLRLGFIGLAELADRMPASLSGGQRRCVAIARAIAARPRLLLFDDPTTGLDRIIATVDDEIVKLRDFEHVTCLVVTHQIRDAFYIATHQSVRRDGQLRIVAGAVHVPA
jgi:phospholipid/cholesterol/gamma-HCH transport system ATP-binding protein